MVIEKSPDWLPAGWIREAKQRQDGRKDWYYSNLKTGVTCRSKIEVTRHTESGNPCNHMPRQIKRCSQDNDKQLVQMEDLPTWLPTGWSMVTKTRKSGNRVGESYKCYIAPITGWKFYSQREVFCHIKTGKPRRRASARNKNHGSEPDESHASEPNESLASEPNESLASEPNESHASELNKCHATEPDGSHASEADGSHASEPNKIHACEPNESHTSEPNGSHASELDKSHASEPDKSHTSELDKSHASEPNKSHESQPNKRGIGMRPTKSASKVVVEKHTAEGFPPGWIKAIKVTQLADRIRKDPYYIDPVTGYEFRSKNDAFRYLESGDVGKCKIRPKKRQISDMESIDGERFPPTAAKRHKIAGNATRRSLFPDNSSRSSKEVGDELVLESFVVENCLPLSWVRLDGEGSQMISKAHQEPEGMKNVGGKMVSAENGFISAPGPEVFPDRQSLEILHSTDGGSSKLVSAAQESGGEDVEEMACPEKGRISAPAADVSSEKLASEKPHSVNGESSALVSVAQQESGGLESLGNEIVYSENGFISAPPAKISQKKQTSDKSLAKRKSRAQTRTSNFQDGKEFPLPRRASKRLAGLQAELEPNLEISERALRMTTKQSVNLEANPATGVEPSSCSRQESKQGHPPEASAGVLITSHTSRGAGVLLDRNPSKEVEKPVEELIRNLESEKQSSDKPESPLVLPFGDSWPDPCLEFAFKTLTGAIPVDDNLVIGSFFQQNLSMGQDQSRGDFTLPDLGSDSCCQTDTLFQFKPTAKQQSSGKPIFTPEGNRGVAASGDGAERSKYR